MTKTVDDAAYLCPNCYGASQTHSINSGSWNQTIVCNACNHVIPNVQYGQAYGPPNPKTQVVNGRHFYNPKMPTIPPPISQPKPVEKPKEKKYIAMETIMDNMSIPEYSRWDDLD